MEEGYAAVKSCEAGRVPAEPCRAWPGEALGVGKVEGLEREFRLGAERRQNSRPLVLCMLLGSDLQEGKSWCCRLWKAHTSHRVLSQVGDAWKGMSCAGCERTRD